MKTLVATLAVAAILMMPLSAYAASGSAGATGSVTISGTCGITLNATTIDYGTLAPNTSTNATNNVGVTNSGTGLATLYVSGGNWTDSNRVTQIDANETFAALSPVLVSDMVPAGQHLNLDGTPVLIMANLGSGNSVATYWALIAKLLHPVAETLTQAVTFTTSC